MEGGDSGYMPGLSMDGQSLWHPQILWHGGEGGGGGGGGGGGKGGHPWTICGWSQFLWHTGILWRGGGVDIPGLSVDGHSYSGIRGYSDMGGGIRVDICGLSRDGHSYSGIRGYSNMEREGGRKGGHPWTMHGWSQLLSAKYKATVSSMDGSGLSTAPLDISVQ